MRTKMRKRMEREPKISWGRGRVGVRVLVL